jgi:hypothetical protein
MARSNDELVHQFRQRRREKILVCGQSAAEKITSAKCKLSVDSLAKLIATEFEVLAQ